MNNNKSIKFEESYVDIISKLNRSLSTDIIEPDDKEKINRNLEELQSLLWKYSY